MDSNCRFTIFCALKKELCCKNGKRDSFVLTRTRPWLEDLQKFEMRLILNVAVVPLSDQALVTRLIHSLCSLVSS